MNLWAVWVSSGNCFFCLPWKCWDSMGIKTSDGTRVAPLRAFLGLFVLCFSPGVRGVMALGGLGGQGLETDFRHYDKIIHWNRGRYSFPILDSYSCMLALGSLPESISDGCDFGPWSCRPLPEWKLKRKTIVRTFNFFCKVFIM